MTKIIPLVLFVVLAASKVMGQDLPEVQTSDEFKGKVKTITYERTILVRGGSSVPPTNQKLITESYDREGRILSASRFGNIEQRFSFDYAAKPSRVTLSYFDNEGKPTSSPFVPNANAIAESDLCSRYSIREENDAAANIERDTEICENGTVRARTSHERDTKNRLFRELREDALKRTWESKYRYDEAGEVIEYIFSVNDQHDPGYWQTINYVDIKYDKERNWIQKVGSSFHSKAPGRLAFQFLEKRTIEYYTN